MSPDAARGAMRAWTLLPALALPAPAPPAAAATTQSGDFVAVDRGGAQLLPAPRPARRPAAPPGRLASRPSRVKG